MTLEEVKAKLVGRTITEVHAGEWAEEYGWLDDFGAPEIVLDDGTIIRTPGEPISIVFPT